MMNKNAMSNGGWSISLSGCCAIALFLLAFICWQPRAARAQGQWSTSGNGTDSYTNGNVGIGTSTPGASLEINKSQNAGTTITLDNGYTTTGNGAYSGFLFKQAGAFRFYFGSNNDGNSIQHGGWGAVQLKNYVNAPIIFGTSDVERMRISGTGNLGIGVTSPAQKLDLGGNFSIYGATVINSNRVLSARSSFNAYTGDGVWGSQAMPSTIFTPSSHINTGFYFGYEDEGSGQYTPSLGISVPPTPTSNARVFQLRRFGGTSPEAYNRFEMSVVGKLSWGSGTSAVDTSITRSSAGTLALSGGFNVTGNIGVGTQNTSATTKLDVSGNTNITGSLNVSGTIEGGTINAKYQDVAEWVPSRQKLAAGTVVILDPEKSNQVIASTESYDTRVAGVISEQPGVLLGEGGEGKVKVATTGRVKVKVDASRGAIRIGDLLVSSGEEGVAMKSEPIKLGEVEIHRPGTLIGKALEPLEKGKGEILVLLSLQ